MSLAKDTSPKPLAEKKIALGALSEPTSAQLQELETVLRYESLLEIVWAAAGGEIDLFDEFLGKPSDAPELFADGSGRFATASTDPDANASETRVADAPTPVELEPKAADSTADRGEDTHED